MAMSGANLLSGRLLVVEVALVFDDGPCEVDGEGCCGGPADECGDAGHGAIFPARTASINADQASGANWRMGLSTVLVSRTCTTSPQWRASIQPLPPEWEDVTHMTARQEPFAQKLDWVHVSGLSTLSVVLSGAGFVGSGPGAGLAENGG